NSYESVSSTPSHASSTSIQSTDSSVSAASTVSNTSSVGTVPGPQVTDAKGEQAAPLEASGIVEVSEEEFERAKRSPQMSKVKGGDQTLYPTSMSASQISPQSENIDGTSNRGPRFNSVDRSSARSLPPELTVRKEWTTP
ncbi:hypothetical protein FS842_003272, partial [Serendipita sp. 407]